MKKVITICLLVATLIAGGMTMDAKTTKKKTRTTASRSSSNDGASYLYSYMFFSADGFYRPSMIIDDLKGVGFKLKSTSKVRTEYGDSYVTAKKSVYTSGNATVSIWEYSGDTIEVDIKFTRTSDLNSFIDRMRSHGWEYSDTYGGSKCYYWEAGSMYVDGLSVTLTYGG